MRLIGRIVPKSMSMEVPSGRRSRVRCQKVSALPSVSRPVRSSRDCGEEMLPPCHFRVREGRGMALLHYLKPVDGLSDPRGFLASEIPSRSLWEGSGGLIASIELPIARRLLNMPANTEQQLHFYLRVALIRVKTVLVYVVDVISQWGGQWVVDLLDFLVVQHLTSLFLYFMAASSYSSCFCTVWQPHPSPLVFAKPA